VAAEVEECTACDAGTVTVTFGISDTCTEIYYIYTIYYVVYYAQSSQINTNT